MKRILLSAIALAAFMIAPAIMAQVAPPAEPIVIVLPGISPEGIEWDSANSRFLISSLTDGIIRSVDDAGSAEIFIQDGDVTTSVGIEVDEANTRLLVAVGEASVFFDPASSGVAALAAYDLETGERQFWVDLGALYPDGRHFANDVAVDDEGNAYVTDSFSPVLYRVDSEGNAEIFVEDERLGSAFLGANGIVFHPDGYLLVAVSGTNTVYKVPLDAPETMTVVESEELLSIDGMVLDNDGTLYAVNNGTEQALLALTSDDEWATATLSASVLTGGSATTVTVRDGIPFYINAYLGNQNASQYEIVPVVLE
jgi:sugar lactone lactonase YvrE